MDLLYHHEKTDSRYPVFKLIDYIFMHNYANSQEDMWFSLK